MKTHQRERKYKCKECSRAFKIHSDLKRHAVVHQGEVLLPLAPLSIQLHNTKKLQMACDAIFRGWRVGMQNCNLIFRRRDNLVRHLKNLHPESPMVISMRQAEDKESEEQQCEPTCSKPIVSHNTICHAVSVIRAVPVIQKVNW